MYNPFEHRHQLAFPYQGFPGQHYEYNYVPENSILGYSTLPQPEPNLNLLAELPYAISNEFSVVPMYIVSENAMNMISQGHITSASAQQPIITVKLNTNNSMSCTPAVRMVLEKPIIVGSLRSSVLFPTEIQIIHDGVKIPIKIGAVFAPVLANRYVSEDTPIAVKVVYAVPTKPIKITITIDQENDDLRKPGPETQINIEQNLNVVKPQDIPNANENPAPENSSSELPIDTGFGALSNSDYVNNADAVFIPNQEAVVVESESELPPKNITVIDFPEQEAEPQLEVDEEDEELVNRNPPQVLAPAGIVQSTQPQYHIESFHNDKESPYLETLREQSNKKKGYDQQKGDMI